MGEVTRLNNAREAVPACVHHWVLSDPEAGAISGRCKRCGGERTFSVRPEGSDRFSDDRGSRQPDAYAAGKTG
ncbi:MAG: hypothetical protein WD942_00880 [Dehalococcoidia bacterium]